MSTPGGAREMLILEALGDVGKLLDRVDDVKASIEASCEALSQANAALQAQSATIDARIATLTLSLAAFSSRATRRSSRHAISRCTSSVSRSSKDSSAAAVLWLWSCRACTMPSRRRVRS